MNNTSFELKFGICFFYGLFILMIVVLKVDGYHFFEWAVRMFVCQFKAIFLILFKQKVVGI